MQERMKNPASIIPEAMQAIQVLVRATHKGGVAPETLALVHLRASQINGCSFCVDAGWRSAKKKDSLDAVDWRAFYEAVKEFLEDE